MRTSESSAFADCLNPNASLKFNPFQGRPCPGGTRENSPALQRWEGSTLWLKSRRDGRLGEAGLRVQPSLRDSALRRAVPGVETPGYSQVSLRDRAPPNLRKSSAVTGFYLNQLAYENRSLSSPPGYCDASSPDAPGRASRRSRVRRERPAPALAGPLGQRDPDCLPIRGKPLDRRPRWRRRAAFDSRRA